MDCAWDYFNQAKVATAIASTGKPVNTHSSMVQLPEYSWRTTIDDMLWVLFSINVLSSLAPRGFLYADTCVG